LPAAVQNTSTVASGGCSPRILTLFNDELHVTVTDKLRIDCRAVGLPVPTISWLFPVGVIDDVRGDDDKMSTSYRTKVFIFCILRRTSVAVNGFGIISAKSLQITCSHFVTLFLERGRCVVQFVAIHS